MTRLHFASILVLATAIAAGAATAAQVQETQGVHYVSRLKYENKGTYRASPLLKWKSASDGQTHTYDPRREIGDGSSYVFDLAKLKNRKPDLGDEVWLVIKITFGETESCHKSHARFYYATDGGTAVFKTAGKTLNSNLCTIVSNGDD